uniref:Cytidyltransferase-like domain-containing protein n=1 Tax=viral metagenome TaxID=1070528 RepID=A0A6C0F2K1_9ZZZZ
MNWSDVWINKNDTIIQHEYNGYKFKNCDEYKTFISEICKNLNLTNNTTILDICCGNGSFIQELIKMKNITNINMYGIDISEINIKYACENYTGNYIVGDIKNPLPYDNNLFDYVIIISSLQYLENDEQLFFLLSEMKRVCKSNGIIFIGNAYDKKMCDDIFFEKKHYMFNRELLFDYFKNNNIVCYDNKYLDIKFYTYVNEKFNMVIHLNNNDLLNIGVDIHDTLSHSPLFFKNLFNNWKGKRILITGTPLSKENEIIELLKNINFLIDIDYDKIEYGYEYDKKDMNYSHFEKMKIHKLNAIKKHKVNIYFDDNPFYVEYLRNYVFVYQTILSNDYINCYNKLDKYFTCNLQEKQFNYLDFLRQKKNVLIPGSFDLFHIGHLNLLNKYKNYDLHVAVQGSQSIFETKKQYPTLTTDERIEFIKNLNITKHVISYTSLNLVNIIKNFEINILVIGPEYGNHNEHLINIDYCNNNNVEIIVESRTENISSTMIKNKIQNKVNNV